MPDYGISTYCHELAEGLAQNGVQVTLLASVDSKLGDLYRQRQYRLLPVLGTFLAKRLITRKKETLYTDDKPRGARAEALQSRAERRFFLRKTQWFLRIRDFMLATELAAYLRLKRYDVVWTHWHEFYGAWAWRMFRLMGLPVVHTVHNVLPHEHSDREVGDSATIYSLSHHLFTHSQFAADELVKVFPWTEAKTSIQWHGLYTVFNNRNYCARRNEVRQRLNIAEQQVAILCCGGIRPYKNIDAAIQSLKSDDLHSVVMVIAGEESGFSDLVPGEPLGRVQRLVTKLGVEEKVRFLPGFLPTCEMEGLFEACDILLLAYEYHSGSGLLLLGMTFGIHILATRTGGAEEYLHNYPAATIIDGCSAVDVTRGLVSAAERVQLQNRICHFKESRLEWSMIAKSLLDQLSIDLADQ